MPSSEPDELLDSWLGDGVEGFTISAVWRNLGVWGDRLVLCRRPPISHSLGKEGAPFTDLIKATATLRKIPHTHHISHTVLGNPETTLSDTDPWTHVNTYVFFNEFMPSRKILYFLEEF